MNNFHHCVRNDVKLEIHPAGFPFRSSLQTVPPSNKEVYGTYNQQVHLSFVCSRIR